MTNSSARPPIHLIDTEADTIGDLALAAQARHPEIAALLLFEIERAVIHDATTLPPGVISMGTHIEFADEGSGAERSVELVYPPEADMGAGRLSILSLVGAGLIGLSQGQTISWPDKGGNSRILRIGKVTPRES